MLMSVNTETASAQGQTAVLEKEGVYASLFEKINLTPASRLGDINDFLDDAALSDAPAGERLTAAMQVFMDCIRKAGQPVEKLDKTLIDHHIAELDYQISCQLDAIMHHEAFQKVESLWRGLKQLVDSTDYSQNVKTEILDVSKDDLRQDFEDAPELIQSGLYWHTYTAEYDTPGGEPIGSVISAYEFDASPQDMALLRNISNVSAAAHMPFIGAVGPAFFLKDSMEEVAAIKDIGNYFDRAEYIKWKSFRDTDDARYIGLVMPRVLGRLPYGPDTVPVRSFNYVEQVKGPDHEKYLWTSASFSFAANMVKSFINNGWCVQIRGPQAGGAVKDLPIHLYDLGTGKLMIVDDRYVLVGSANINDRSLQGDRDSELAVLISDTAHCYTDLDGTGVAAPTRNFARELRQSAWRKWLGSAAGECADVLDKPALKKGWEKIQMLAKKNAETYEIVFDFIPKNYIDSNPYPAEITPSVSDTESTKTNEIPASIWPVMNTGDKIKSFVRSSMPFSEIFWRNYKFQNDGSLHAIKGYFTALPIYWTEGENNMIRYNMRLIASNAVSADDTQLLADNSAGDNNEVNQA
ncbi:type VI secretion system contractile sheath large subunit [Klebsiella grimontii]|nr:type VI secretion system contractile sheath large subunit [Klebsiella grimontii]